MTELKTEPNFVILHGNHDCKAEDGWYTNLHNKLIMYGYKSDLRTHKDKIINSRVKIITTLKDEIKCDENKIIIGHSSGALACMRYAELHPILGLVLVAPYVTHLGIKNEKKSGYFDYPWKPDEIRKILNGLYSFHLMMILSYLTMNNLKF